MAIWYIFPVLVCFTKTNLATLPWRLRNTFKLGAGERTQDLLVFVYFSRLSGSPLVKYLLNALMHACWRTKKPKNSRYTFCKCQMYVWNSFENLVYANGLICIVRNTLLWNLLTACANIFLRSMLFKIGSTCQCTDTYISAYLNSNKSWQCRKNTYSPMVYICYLPKFRICICTYIHTCVSKGFCVDNFVYFCH
jgi:hypothetical protein